MGEISSSAELDVQGYTARKRNVLFGRLTLFAGVLSLIHTASDALDGLRAAPLIDLGLTLVLFAGYGLNRRGQHRSAKITVLLVLNLALAVYASLIPAEIGVYLFYLPLACVSAVVFDYNAGHVRYAFIGLPMVMLVLLFLFDFKLLGNLSIRAEDMEASFLLNLFSSTLMILFCIYFMVSLNEAAENWLSDLAREVQQKNIRLEKANAELDRFLYSTSHDLRAPLMSIKGLIHLAQREVHTATPAYLRMMDQQIEKLDSFIGEIIDYSKNARMEINPEPVDLETTVRDVTSNLRFMEGADKISFQCHIDLEGQPFTDKARLQVILSNLISNSIKYHNLEQTQPYVSVSAQRSNGHWTLSVSDNGKGIMPEHVHKVFDMFYRADERSKGSGLGLYIVKEAVAKLQGQIELQSTPQKGTSFKVTLPWLHSSSTN